VRIPLKDELFKRKLIHGKEIGSMIEPCGKIVEKDNRSM